MSDTKKEKVEKTVEHPMEEVFGIEPGTTIVEVTERTTELVKAETYDDKDDEIEEQFQEVYDAAMGAFEDQSEEAALVEGKYKARNAEVAANFLSTALNAVTAKSNMKVQKDKLEKTVAGGGAKTVNNNITVTHSELLKALGEKDITPKDPIEGEIE